MVVAIFVACEDKKKATALGPEAFSDLMTNEISLQLVDVRTPQEFLSRHLENALLIDLYSPDFDERISNLNKEQPIAVYCEVGQRSYQVFEMLQEKGFKEVYHLEGGINAWINAKKPVQW